MDKIHPICYLNPKVICTPDCRGYARSLERQSSGYSEVDFTPQVEEKIQQVSQILPGILGLEGAIEAGEEAEIYCPEKSGDITDEDDREFDQK
jgi:hypothetical protein